MRKFKKMKNELYPVQDVNYQEIVVKSKKVKEIIVEKNFPILVVEERENSDVRYVVKLKRAIRKDSIDLEMKNSFNLLTGGLGGVNYVELNSAILDTVATFWYYHIDS